MLLYATSASVMSLYVHMVTVMTAFFCVCLSAVLMIY